MTVLETERLTLRRFSIDDVGFVIQLLNEPSFLRYIGDKGVRTPDDAREYLRKGPIDSYQRFGFGLYLVELKSNGTPIGMCGLLKRESLEDVDVGFAFLPQFWLQGYAFESASAALEHGKKDFGLDRIVGVTQSDNTGSIKTLEKLGLEFERMVKLAEDDDEVQLFGIEF